MLDQQGQPIPEVSIEAQSLDTPTRPIPEVMIVTDEQGHYRWRLFSGHYMISAIAEGYRKERQSIEVRKGKASTLDFILIKGK